MIRKTLMPLAAAVLFTPLAAHAVVLDLEASVVFLERGTAANPDSDLFTISSTSDAGAFIVGVTIDLTLAADSPVFDTVDGCTAYCYGAETGWPVTAISGAGDTGFVMPTAGEQASWEEASVISLVFTDFGGGESMQFTTDIDDLSDFFIPPGQMAGASISVTFAGAGFDDVTLTANFAPVAGAPFWDAEASVQGEVTVIPVPGALLLFGSALVGLAARRRRTTIV